MYIGETAKILFRLERRSILDSILELYKARNSTTTTTNSNTNTHTNNKKHHIIQLTNILLQKHILIHIIQSLEYGIQYIKDKNNSTTTTTNTNTTSTTTANTYICHIDDLVILSYIIYYICYDTQLVNQELTAIIDLIRTLSTLLITRIDTISSSDIGISAFYNISFTSHETLDREHYIRYLKTVEKWKKSGMVIIMTLQLSLSCVLVSVEEGLSKLDRYTDIAPYRCKLGDSGEGLSGTTSDYITYNIVKTAIDKSPWQSRGVLGYISILMSIYALPYIQSGTIDSNEVITYLKQASSMRGYSYIRLCILPLLQHCVSETSLSPSYVASYTTLSFLTDTLQECLIELARIYAIYKDYNIYITTNNIELIKQTDMTIDCLDDVMNMYSIACNICVSLPVILANDSYTTTTNTNTSISNPYQYHPFFVRCIEFSWKNPNLMLAGIRLLGAIGRYIWSVPELYRDKVGCNSKAIYYYMYNNNGPKRNMNIWDFLLNECIDMFAVQLSGSATGPGAQQLGALGQTSGSTGTGSREGQSGTGTSSLPQSSSNENIVLSDIDNSYLIEIANLIASIARCPEVAQALYTEYHMIPRLFALASCPVSIYLKGALYNALASLAYGYVECAREVWVQLEVHNVLNFPTNSALLTPTTTITIAPTTTQQSMAYNTGVSNISGATSSLSPGFQHQKGLRFELESSESFVGAYPITEGFCTLLESALNHGVPDMLGQEYRIPGIIAYIEYVLDDVLGRLKYRKYCPEGDILGQSQRWRLTTKVVRILTLVIKHYRINAINDQGEVLLSETTPTIPPSDEWKALISTPPTTDFAPPQSVTYKIRTSNGSIKEEKGIRPKSAGFYIMSSLLSSGNNPSKLLTHIFAILQECSLYDIHNTYTSIVDYTLETTVSIISIMQPPVKPPLIYGLDENLSEIGFGTDIMSGCDGYYWKEKTAVACIGLLYEVHLREATFLHAVRTSPFPLTYTKTEHGRYNTITLVPQDFTESLCIGIHLSQITQYIKYTPIHGVCICLPSVATMIYRLLQYVAKNQPVSTFLYSMSAVADSTRHECMVIETCVQCLLSYTPSQLEYISNSDISKLAIDYGTLYYYTSSPEASLHAPLPGAEYVKLLLTNGNIKLFGHNSENIRKSVLSLLSICLSSLQLCYSHVLLGLKTCIQNFIGHNSDPSHLAALLPDPTPGRPNNCLEAMIELLTPPLEHYSDNLTGILLIYEPSSALVCYELIHRLCTQPLTSTLILAYLRKPTVNFLGRQFELLLCSLSWTDDVLYEAINRLETINRFETKDGCKMEESPSPEARIEEIKRVRHHCIGWLLHIFTLEISIIESTIPFSSNKLHGILDLLFFYNNPTTATITTSSSDSNSSIDMSISPITHILYSAFDLPTPNFPPVTSHTILQCMSMSTIPYTISINDNTTTSSSNNSDISSMFTVIDIPYFTKLILQHQKQVSSGITLTNLLTLPMGHNYDPLTQNDIELGIYTAIGMNIYQQRICAAIHIIRAWERLIEYIFYGHTRSYILSSFGLNTSDSIQKYTDAVVIPTLKLLVGVEGLEMVMGERVVQCIVCLISVLSDAYTTSSDSSNSSGSSDQHSEQQQRGEIGRENNILLLTTTQHHILLTLSIQCLLIINATSTSTSSFSGFKMVGKQRSTSVYYRGCVYNILSMTLTMGRGQAYYESDLKGIYQVGYIGYNILHHIITHYT